MLKNTKNVVLAVQYAEKTRKHWVTFVEENEITRDKIADAAREIAALAYPNDETVQTVDGKRTRYGNAVQAAGYMMRSVLATDDDDSAPTVALITRAGAKASKEDIIAAWEAAQS